MSSTFTGRKRIRKYFGKVKEIAQIPNLIEVQKYSYDQFLLIKEPKNGRQQHGLHSVFSSVFPITDFSGNAVIEYLRYEFDKPKFDVEECQQRDMTFAAPLKVTLRLIVFEEDEEIGVRSVKDIKEQEVYMGDIPLMTKNGTFVINGTERVIVSQMHRSPGVFFDHDKGKTHASGKLLYAARVIPYRGSWLDIEFDPKDILNVRIDRRRKLPATTMLHALNMSDEEILGTFYNKVFYTKIKDGWSRVFSIESYQGSKPSIDLIDADTREIIFQSGIKITARKINQAIENGLKNLFFTNEDLYGYYFASEVVDIKTGEIFIECGDEINEEVFEILVNQKFQKIPILDIDHVNVGPYLRNTLKVDKSVNYEGALSDIYRVMRPGEPPTVEASNMLFKGLFFSPERYDLSAVGRVKMNIRLDLNCEDSIGVLRKEDIIEVIKTLINLRDGKGKIDDIDNLGNRRVRSVGELLENQYRVGLLRMERAIKERMSSVEIDTVMPHDLINAKPIQATVREFFGSSQLSQFMDQTNPLSEVTHKRRISALGPGGLTRERAGFEVRDVHPTHYGRICPIETPEGPNIGLINSLATFARVNKYGFIESPYIKVKNGQLTEEVIYLSAMEEFKFKIGQANVPLTDNRKFIDKLLVCRQGGEVVKVVANKVDFVDVSPKQLVSVAASLIPFLENDDANRALMGSNMQRQAVPLLKAEAPLVGTGMEAIVARDSGASVIARRLGIVDQVDATRIVVRATGEIDPTKSGVDIYNLLKFQRSNQNTCINQRPLVKVGDVVSANDIIADGPSTDLGELALGKNVLVAFMPWNGYNFEDSILISERIVRDDVFTSIHIEEFEISARDTKLGAEEITRDIPNVGEEQLKNLDESGIVYIGAEVKPGDFLVGKITPKGESPMTPEEKLLRAIFGEKAADVRDTSMKLPPGVAGTVVEVRVFNRHGVDKDERGLSIEREEIELLAKDRDDEILILDRVIFAQLKIILINKKVSSNSDIVIPNSILTDEIINNIPRTSWRDIDLDDKVEMNKIKIIINQYDKSKLLLEERFVDKINKIQRGDELSPGVMKMVKVFVAVKRKLQPGDKMAGRHGNKGVISKIVPLEDMPYLEDGTIVDLVLNPLGVPSRMNVGQILETHMGWAAAGLGRQISEALEMYQRDTKKIKNLKNILKIAYGNDNEILNNMSDEEIIELSSNLKYGVPIATPVFDGAHEDDIVDLLNKSGLDSSGQSWLYDGRTGNKFDRKVTVGYKYLLKLHHLVDDKIHARSIGPYSLVTQQPLGGKAQFGGQRFGEMEVWALMAYGAAYTLQEMLTVKSDDVAGRTKVYESIVRADDSFEAGLPESFNVLIKEMKSLGLNVELENSLQLIADEADKNLKSN